MWINIYGNRSYQDVSQYPVFPWLLTNFESDKFEKLISDSNNIRDLRLPLGLINLDEKGKYRQNGYIESYKIMIMDLIDKNFLKMKMKDDDIEEETNNIEKASPSLYSILTTSSVVSIFFINAISSSNTSSS